MIPPTIAWVCAVDAAVAAAWIALKSIGGVGEGVMDDVIDRVGVFEAVSESVGVWVGVTDCV